MVDFIYVHAHIIGGTLYLLPGAFMAHLCYRRLHELATSTNNFSVDDYGGQYFPEPSPGVLKGLGLYFFCAAILGYMILTITEVPYGMSLFEDTFHMMIYFLFGSSGMVYMLEASSKVPRESGRVTFALALAFESLLLGVHSQMKETKVGVLQHQFIGLTTGIAALSLFLSVQYKNWLLPYVVFLVTFIWHALWWITIGFCFLMDPEDLDMGDICVYFSLEGMILYFVVLTMASKLEKASGGDSKQHEVLSLVTDTTLEEDDEEHLPPTV